MSDPLPREAIPPAEPAGGAPTAPGSNRIAQLLTAGGSFAEKFEEFTNRDLGKFDPRYFLESTSSRLLRNRRVRPLVVFVQAIWPFLAVFGAIYLVCGAIFFLIERPAYSFPNSLYFAVLTFATNNIGNIVPTSPAAQALVLGMTIAEVFVLAFLISALATRAEDVARRDALGLLGTDFEQHVVVMGATDVGLGSVQELLLNQQRVALVTEAADDVANLRGLGPRERLYLTYGRLTEAELLRRVNLPKARSVIVAGADDSTNMIVALTVRRVAPNVRVVVSVSHPELRPTMQAAGISFVASPAEMAARICASATFEPEVANSVDELTTSKVGSDVIEFVLGPTSPLVGRSFTEALQTVVGATGGILIGYARRAEQGHYEMHLAPPGPTPLRAADAVVLICAAGQGDAVRAWFGQAEGR